MVKLVYALTLILGAGTLIISYLAFKKWKYAKQHKERMEWLYSQLERALKQIESRNVDEIKAGLQSIRGLNVLSIRLRALPRLTELLTHENPGIVILAKDAIENIYPAKEAQDLGNDESPLERWDNAMSHG
jgi:hypothetical protein